jgi:hypothetical protein
LEKTESLQAFQWNDQEKQDYTSDDKDDDVELDEELNDYELELLTETGVNMNWREEDEEVDDDIDEDYNDTAF